MMIVCWQSVMKITGKSGEFIMKILIGKDMVREPIRKMTICKAAGRSRFVSEMVKALGKAQVGIIAVLVNQIIVEGVITAEWELSSDRNCCKGKKDASKSSFPFLKGETMGD